MIGSFETERLNGLLKDFYTVVGIRISVFDDAFRPVTEYPAHPPALCARIRGTDAGRHACALCDREACLRAKTMNGPHTYLCHAGVTEAITPIRLDGGVIGYAILAHLMPEERYEETVRDVVRRCRAYGMADADTEERVRELARYPRARIDAAMRLLDAVASYLQISKMAAWKNENIAFQINSFLDGNLGGELSSALLCSHFFLSRSKLYEISMQAFGMSIARYIAHKRIERAKQLLAEGRLSVAEVARRVGIPDYNYFCKRFKRAVGVSPGKFRRSGV